MCFLRSRCPHRRSCWAATATAPTSSPSAAAAAAAAACTTPWCEPIKEPEFTEPPHLSCLPRCSLTGKISRRAVVFCVWRMGDGAQTTHVCEGGMGVIGEHWKPLRLTLGTTAAKFNAGLACLTVLQQCQWQQWRASRTLGLGNGNGEVVKGFHGQELQLRGSIRPWSCKGPRIDPPFEFKGPGLIHFHVII